MILLAVADEQELVKAAREFDAYIFYEPDFPKGLNSACTRPQNAIERGRFRRFRLWKPPKESG